MHPTDKRIARRLIASWRPRRGFVDTQELARTYYPGDVVATFLGNHDAVGRLLAVYPATGMADVQWPHGIQRISVEEIQLVSRNLTPTISESMSPVQKVMPIQKQAIYWAAPDRKYRANGDERSSGHYACPRCGKRMLGATHRRQGGANMRILACWKCKFLVDPCDIEGHPSFVMASSGRGR